MYTLITRPDVATPVSMCARYLAEPTKAHLNYAFRILRYLIHTQRLCLTYSYTPNPILEAYVDASWADNKDNRRSRFGYAIYFGNALISWRSKLQKCVCLSTAEAEYVGATEVCKEVMYLRLALSEVGYRQDEPTIVHEDNTACISMVKNKIVSARNKHMELKMHFVREQVERKVVQLKKISTQKQRADLLTKNLPRPSFEHLRLAMLNPKLYGETLVNSANVC